MINQNKHKGVIFGQAIGDALGLGAEFMTTEEVNHHYPDGLKDYTLIIQDKHRSRWQKGSWTDDTDQLLIILDSIINKKGVDLLDIAKGFYDWYQNAPMGIGLTTLRVLSTPQYKKYPQKASYLAWKLKRGRLAPNGGIMRTSVLGIWQYWNMEEVLKNASDVCSLTHYDQRCRDSCKVVCYIIASELQGKSVSQDELLTFTSALDPRMSDYIENSLLDQLESLQLDEKQSMGYTLKTMVSGLYAYYHATDYESGLRTIIEQGGDADSNGAVAGSLLGAKFGYDAIPKHWIDGLIKKDTLENKCANLLELINSQLS